MTINYTTLLGLAQPVTGTEEGTWGDTVNDAITALVEQAVAGGATIDVTAGDVTLTSTDGVSNQARNAILLVTGTPGTSRNVIAPSKSKIYIVKNSSDGSIVLKGSATTGVTIPVGVEAVCFWNGSDFEIAALTGPSTATDNAVARFDGTTGKVIQNSAVTIADTSGDITGGRYNKITITAPANGSTLTILDGKVLTVNNTLTLAGTDSTTMTFPSTSASIARTDAGQTFTGDQVIAGNLTMNAQGDVRFADSDSSNWVAFQGPATVASNVTWTLPATDGSSGQVLSTNGSGTLSWATTVSTPGGSDTQIQYNSSNTFAGAAGLTTDGSNLTVRAQGDVRFSDSDSSNWVAFQGAATIASNVTWTLPSADGTSGQFLSTDGSGTLSWATASGGGGGGGTAVTVTQITATASQTTFNVTYTVGQISVYLNGALLASADYTATNGTSVVLGTGAASGDIFTAVVYSTVTGLTINTASPFNTWVGSSAGAANTTGANNVAVGYQAMDVNTTGYENVGIGSGALGANTTGFDNVAIGYNALLVNTTGANNTAVGAASLDANTIGVYNTAVGSFALTSNTTGSYNTAVGQSALNSNTTGSNNGAFGSDTGGYSPLWSNTTGSNNNAFGNAALSRNTTGSNNSAFGHQALLANTTASNNTAVGYAALDANTTGVDNTAVGVDALGANTTGANNTAVGRNALKSATTSTNNCAFGLDALQANTTGGENTGIGKDALRANTTGGGSTAVGYQAAYSNTTGGLNTAIGYQALYANTGGGENVAVGYKTLDANTTGLYNTAVGDEALGSSTTASNNTAIGYAAGFGNTTGTNNVALGVTALYTNTTGSGNVALGVNALRLNTTGAANTAVGGGALYTNTTGGSNTALGSEALNSATTADGNTAVGYRALYLNTTGVDNTAVGFQALDACTTGQGHTCVGENAGGNITTGSNNTCFGLNAGTDAVRNITTANDEGVFGNNATVGLYVKVAWTATSDIRDKTNISAVPHGLDFVSKINPIKYQYKKSREDDTPTGFVRYGFSAQEILALEGDNSVIINAQDPENLKITDQNLIAVLVNAIKELKAEIDQLKGN